MFQFPALARTDLYIQSAVTPSACTVTTGCPIRKSLGQSLFDSSPGLIAAYRVLHRLITPRHPPYTLSSLTTFVAGPEGTATSAKLPQFSLGDSKRNLSGKLIPMHFSKSQTTHFTSHWGPISLNGKKYPSPHNTSKRQPEYAVSYRHKPMSAT